MARLNAKWYNFWNRGQDWYHFWQDTDTSITTTTTTTTAVVSGGLKTINGLVKASIKSWNGLSFASIKVFNGLLVGSAPSFTITFDSIANVPVADASSVANWNSWFYLPSSGTSFSSVSIVNNTVTFIGGANIQVQNQFATNTHITKIEDTIGSLTSGISGCFSGLTVLTTIRLYGFTVVIDHAFVSNTVLTTIDLPNATSLGDSAFSGCSANVIFNLPKVTSIGKYIFNSCTLGTTFNLPLCTTTDETNWYLCPAITNIDLSSIVNLGLTTGDDTNFYGITGQTITLKVKAAIMTVNGGSPDGDIAALQASNTVTVIQV